VFSVWTRIASVISVVAFLTESELRDFGVVSVLSVVVVSTIFMLRVSAA
jgi:hypothetical protein